MDGSRCQWGMTAPPSSSDGRAPQGPRAVRLPRANVARRGQPRAQPATAAAEDEELHNIVAIGQSRFELAGKTPPAQPEVEYLSDRGSPRNPLHSLSPDQPSAFGVVWCADF